MGMLSTVTGEFSPQPCTNCGDVSVKGQWWCLNNYFGISGYFCPTCYELVSHDAYRNPRHPKDHEAVLVAQQIRRTNHA